MHAIEIESLKKTFKTKKYTKVEALKGITFSVDAGEVFGFLGPNGAGKSTTIKLLMGLIRPDSGTAKLMGKDIKSASVRKHVGYLPENPSFFDYLTGSEYLRFAGKSFGMSNAEVAESIEKVLELFELKDAAKRRIRQYSKGMVQRLGLAQALLHDPDVYILDEPMSGLDPVGRALVKNVILELKAKGKSVFFSTHIISDVEAVCDRVGIISGGVLKSIEKVETILSAGIAGYVIRYREQNGEENEMRVLKDEISGKLITLKSEGAEIIFIDHNRRSLEDFFLNIIKHAPSE